MKQIRFDSFGPPSLVARCVEVPDVASPAAWEVIVNIEAFPINVSDLAILAGRYGKLPILPSTIGMEAVGRVAAVGKSVKDLAIGDRVVLLANDNWMEQRKLPAAAVHKVPENLDLFQAAMLKVNPSTALLLLTAFVKLEQGDWILQNAPLSSVGSCVIQIAKARGIRTINVVRRSESIPRILELGGDVALEDGPDLAARVQAAVRHEPLRLAFDAIAGAGVQRLAECLSEAGTVVNYGMLSGEPCQLKPEQTIFRGIDLKGFWLTQMLNRLSHADRRDHFEALVTTMASGGLKIDVDSRFFISEIQQAVRRAEEPKRSGKVLVHTSNWIG